jgi:hypothetical protein
MGSVSIIKTLEIMKTLPPETKLEQLLKMLVQLEPCSETVWDWVGVGASSEQLSECDEEILKTEWQ